MSADVLRQAAALMRERAENALSDPAMRTAWDAEVYDDGRAWINSHDGHALSLHGYPSVAEHIASWHPAVALAVAKWLDATAARIDAGRDPKDGGRRNHGWRGSREALAVARAYLGESA